MNRCDWCNSETTTEQGAFCAVCTDRFARELWDDRLVEWWGDESA